MVPSLHDLGRKCLEGCCLVCFQACAYLVQLHDHLQAMQPVSWWQKVRHNDQVLRVVCCHTTCLLSELASESSASLQEATECVSESVS